MISMLLILALFTAGIAALAWLGRRVPHPDDERAYTEALERIRRDTRAAFAAFGAALRPNLAASTESIKQLGVAFGGLAQASAKAAEAFRSFGGAYYDGLVREHNAAALRGEWADLGVFDHPVEGEDR